MVCIHWWGISAPFGSKRPSERSVGVDEGWAVDFGRNCMRWGILMREDLYGKVCTLGGGLLSGWRIGGI